jgi:spore coat polysaccharide biosynthesis protein SpsF
VLYPLAERRVLEWVVHWASESAEVDAVYCTIGDNPENDALLELCERKGIHHRQGPEGNLLERHREIATTTDCDLLCRVTGDCPFVPPSEITRTIEAHRDSTGRYTTNHTPAMPVGTAVDVLDPSILDELAEMGDTHPVRRLREEPETWGTVKSDTEQWTQFSDAHTAVDTPDDYWRLVDAVDAIGTNPFDVTQWMAEQS